MSRSNPTDGIKNPSTRWFDWAGGSEGGYVRWYNKDAKEDVKIGLPFTFLLLDELSTVKGWHEASESGIYANEVRDTRQDALVVRSFKGGELASGFYSSIRDRIIAVGGHYCVSLYLAYKESDVLRLGNLSLKGAAASAWMEFKRSASSMKDANGKTLRAYFVDAIKIADFEQAKKGATVYRIPKFSFSQVSDATNQQAVALDLELQSLLSEYLKRPKAEAAKQDSASPFDDLENDNPFEQEKAPLAPKPTQRDDRAPPVFEPDDIAF